MPVIILDPFARLDRLAIMRKAVCRLFRRKDLVEAAADDLRAIATLTGSGGEGAIVGKALYAGRFTLPQALDAVRE